MTVTRQPPAPTSARLRFVVKKVAIVGTKNKFEYRVYDQQRGSFPYRTPELGEVAQDHGTEKDAQTEADRLTETFGYVNEKAMSGRSAKRAAAAADNDDD